MNLQPNATKSGFTLIEFMVIAVVLAVLVGIYLPGIIRPRPCTGCGPNCVNNLKQIGLAFRQWALDNGDRFPMQVSTTNWGTMEWVGRGPVYFHFLVMSNELNTPKVLFCPNETDPWRSAVASFGITTNANTSYLTNDSNVSYFVGVDAEDTKPSMLLAGDHHFTVGGKRPSRGVLRLWTNSPVAWTKPARPRHEHGGNIALADGSVQAFNDHQFRKALSETGVVTNRLAMP